MSDAVDPQPTSPNRRRMIVTVAVAVVVVGVIFGVVLPQLVDWGLVVEAIGAVSGVELLVLASLSIARFLPAGWLYSIALPGLSLRRGVEGWTATTALASSTPGFDIPLRFAMYTSWGASVQQTASSMVLSGIIEMSTKFVIAIVGITLWAIIAVSPGALWLALIGVAVLAVAAITVALVLRSERRARQFGGSVERLIAWSCHRLSRPVPSDVVDRVLEMRSEVRSVLGTSWKRAFAAAATSELMGFAVVVMAIRAVGIDSGTLGLHDILLAHGVVVIVTTIPIVPGALGIAELAYIGVLTPIAGSEFADLIGAGVILARLAVWLLPIPIGWVVALRWQVTSGMNIFGRAARRG